MNHNEIIDALINSLEDKGSSRLSNSDRQLLKKSLFSNYRTEAGIEKGFRLTSKGLVFFGKVFESHTINLPENYEITGFDLVTLDRICTLPYYYNKTMVVLFESQLAILLKLCDGNIAALREMPL